MKAWHSFTMYMYLFIFIDHKIIINVDQVVMIQLLGIPRADMIIRCMRYTLILYHTWKSTWRKYKYLKKTFFFWVILWLFLCAYLSCICNLECTAFGCSLQFLLDWVGSRHAMKKKFGNQISSHILFHISRFTDNVLSPFHIENTS